MITAIFNFFLRLLGIGNQAALDHASEALTNKVTLNQLDTTVLDPPYPYNAEIRAAIEREEDLGTVERFLGLCVEIAVIEKCMEEDRENGVPLQFDEWRVILLTDELFSITAVFNAADTSNDGSWRENTLEDILSEWDWVYRDDLSFSDDELLRIFYPDKYAIECREETLSHQEFMMRCEDLL